MMMIENGDDNVENGDENVFHGEWELLSNWLFYHHLEFGENK